MRSLLAALLAYAIGKVQLFVCFISLKYTFFNFQFAALYLFYVCDVGDVEFCFLFKTVLEGPVCCTVDVYFVVCCNLIVSRIRHPHFPKKFGYLSRPFHKVKKKT